MTPLPGDWTYLGRYLRHEIHNLGSTPREFAQRVGVSYNSLSGLLSGRPRQRWPRFMTRLESVLGWAPGDVARVLNHQEPLRSKPPGASQGEVESWIWAHDALPTHHRRALILAYRAILAADHHDPTSDELPPAKTAS